MPLGEDIPLGNLLESASPAEVKLIETTLETIAVPRQGRGRPRKRPERLIYDKACGVHMDFICDDLVERSGGEEPYRQTCY